jgi:hypothetical protein
MSNKIKSSIDWLENELKERYPLMNSEPLFEQAKAMHRKETCVFAYNCHKRHKVYKYFVILDYYNETYGNDEQQ